MKVIITDTVGSITSTLNYEGELADLRAVFEMWRSELTPRPLGHRRAGSDG